MGVPADLAATSVPSLSALQILLSQSVESQQHGVAAQYHHLALQIAHNLRFQHNWTELHIHIVTLPDCQGANLNLISGLPPDRLYVHPDEQIALLQQQKKQGKSGMPDLVAEREWVVPSHLREQWSLRRLGGIFDAISTVPEPSSGVPIDFGDKSSSSKSEANKSSSTSENVSNPWRTTKRVLLATLDDDSTVVYYIIHDGLVKPRQN